jgi:hypothetical protein
MVKPRSIYGFFQQPLSIAMFPVTKLRPPRVVHPDATDEEIKAEPPSITFLPCFELRSSSSSATRNFVNSPGQSPKMPSSSRAPAMPSSSTTVSADNTLPSLYILAFYPHSGQVISSRLQAREDTDVASHTVSGLSHLMRTRGVPPTVKETPSTRPLLSFVLQPVAEWPVARQAGWPQVKGAILKSSGAGRQGKRDAR